MIWSSRRRIRGRVGAFWTPYCGAGCVEPEPSAVVWRRSLQLRVVTMTLGLSLAGDHGARFRADQPDHQSRARSQGPRRHRGDRAGPHHGQRHRQRRGEPLAGQQPAAGPQHTDDRRATRPREPAWQARSTPCWWCPATGPARPRRPGRCRRCPSRCAISSRRAGRPTSTQRCTPTGSPGRR